MQLSKQLKLTETQVHLCFQLIQIARVAISKRHPITMQSISKYNNRLKSGSKTGEPSGNASTRTTWKCSLSNTTRLWEFWPQGPCLSAIDYGTKILPRWRNANLFLKNVTFEIDQLHTWATIKHVRPSPANESATWSATWRRSFWRFQWTG